MGAHCQEACQAPWTSTNTVPEGAGAGWLSLTGWESLDGVLGLMALMENSPPARLGIIHRHI
ncbi:hypothetical protein GCM10017744_026320 [Streptomyces antimycoticus]|uniref:Uncharacterized protein n=1 Tax=Streptomyces antimycoticus TaxID=68175 RepID=A0A4D4KIY6_9ACTN|nr:hypothetical protein SSPO_025470 [Streptomyces antimycoticus]GDY46720.1 hypothetical protein SANT12839_076020 [Streptomyces antimycoticus]